MVSISLFLQRFKGKLKRHQKETLFVLYSLSVLFVAISVELILENNTFHVKANSVEELPQSSISATADYALSVNMENRFDNSVKEYIAKYCEKMPYYRFLEAKEYKITNDQLVLFGEATNEYELYQAFEGIQSDLEKTRSFSAKTYTEEELNILYRIVEAEATGEDLVGKILVANVILNRIAYEEFPETVKEVVFQKVNGIYQFSPIKDKRYYTVSVTEETKEAVLRAVSGEDYSRGALFFMSRRRTKKAKWFDDNLTCLFSHGNHEFFTYNN